MATERRKHERVAAEAPIHEVDLRQRATARCRCPSCPPRAEAGPQRQAGRDDRHPQPAQGARRPAVGHPAAQGPGADQHEGHARQPAGSVTRVLLAGLGGSPDPPRGAGRLPEVSVVAGVDPAPAYDVPFPCSSTLAEGLAAGPDVVVLATPTASTWRWPSQALASSDALVLSEKPLRADRDPGSSRGAPDAAARAQGRPPLRVLARGRVGGAAGRGAPRVGAADPRRRDVDRRLRRPAGRGPRASLVSSFVDSAPDQPASSRPSPTAGGSSRTPTRATAR